VSSTYIIASTYSQILTLNALEPNLHVPITYIPQIPTHGYSLLAHWSQLSMSQITYIPANTYSQNLPKSVHVITFHPYLQLTPSKILYSNKFIFSRYDPLQLLEMHVKFFNLHHFPTFWSFLQTPAIKIDKREQAQICQNASQIRYFIKNHGPLN
jgi:hypothetical protein